MNRRSLAAVILVAALSLSLAACEGGYTEFGKQASSRQDGRGGEETVKISKANGTATQSIELKDETSVLMDVDVTLSVGKGSYKIELLGRNEQVTLALEARDGKTVTGRGQMAADAFGDADYRVTAVEAENVAYTLKYTFR